jgi:hypothetical protein
MTTRESKRLHRGLPRIIKRLDAAAEAMDDLLKLTSEIRGADDSRVRLKRDLQEYAGFLSDKLEDLERSR